MVIHVFFLCINTYLDVKAHVFVSLMMRRIQFRNELAPLHTGVLSEGTWQRLKSFSKLFNGVLLQARARLQKGREKGI